MTTETWSLPASGGDTENGLRPGQPRRHNEYYAGRKQCGSSCALRRARCAVVVRLLTSWTLGVLQACLQPRAMENLYLQARRLLGVHLDDDSLHDPIRLLTPEQVCGAITKCQTVLERNQLSTINHRARQLTPISIRQLSQPDWAKVLGDSSEGGA